MRRVVWGACALSLVLPACTRPPIAHEGDVVSVAPPPAPTGAPPSVEPAPSPAARLPAGPDLDARAEALARPERRVHVSTDKPLYRPGETVWLRAWDLSGEDGSVTVELKGPRGSRVDDAELLVKAGAAGTGLAIPREARGGAYTVVARFADGATAERALVVVGFEAPRLHATMEFARDAYGPGDTAVATVEVRRATGEPLANRTLAAQAYVGGKLVPVGHVVTDAHGAATVEVALPAALPEGDAVLTVVAEVDGVSESTTKPIPVVTTGLRVALRPEGGDLVEGLPSRVYVEATDRHGRPADVEARVVDDLGATVATFATFRDGLARFELTPDPVRAYHVEVSKPAGHAERYPLPLSRTEGCVLRTFDDFDGKLDAVRAGVRCTAPAEVALVATANGRVLDAARVRARRDRWTVAHLDTREGSGKGEVSGANITKTEGARPGLATVTLLDAGLAPLAERLVFLDRAVKLGVSVRPAREDYGPRDRVSLEIATTGADGEPVAADVAVAVVDDAVLGLADDVVAGLAASTLLGPALVGKIEKPDRYLDPAVEGSGYALDLLLGARGWRRFSDTRPDAGEAPRAKREEGRLGRKDAALNEQQLDRAVAAEAGVLAALHDEAAVGGLIGGGGIAAGLGGIGVRGRGAGFGAGGGNFGAKAEGGIATVTGEPIILGALDRNLIDAVIKRQLAQIRYCYQRELTKNPDLAGKVVVKFVIAKDGTVSSATTKASTLGNPAVETCIHGRFLRWQFPEPRGGGIVIVSYPFVFSPSGRFDGAHAIAGGAPWRTPVWDTPREFPDPNWDPAYTGARTDFRDTVYWAPSVRTGNDGKATVSFSLSDAVTGFRAVAEGFAGGLVGRGETLVASTLPFSLDVRLPLEASAGDRIDLPVTLRPARGAAEIALGAAFGGPLRAIGSLPSTLSLTGARTVDVPVEVLADAGTASVRVSAATLGLADAVDRTFPVVPGGYPAELSRSGTVARDADVRVHVPDVVPGTLRAKVELWPNPLGDVVKGLEGLVQMPTGCFEQASSRNYPNVMVLSLLERGGGPAGLATRTRDLLREGYPRLSGYETGSGGYEWFGADPGHEALTAYGLVMFADMAKVSSVVSLDMVERVAGWLKARRDGEGGYRRNGRALDSFGRAGETVTNAYVTWALVTSGHGDGLAREIDAVEEIAEDTRDPYVLALATQTLFAAGRDGDDAAARLAALQADDGSFPGAAESITKSRGRDLAVETAALAAVALAESGDHPGNVLAAARWIAGQRDGSGRFGATQATVLALKALLRVSGSEATGKGTVDVLVDGAPVARLAYDRAKPDEVVTPDLAAALGPGDHAVTIAHAGDRPVAYTVGLTWRARTPDSHPEAPVAVATALDRDALAMGDTTRLVVTVTNTTGEAVDNPLVRVGIPGGLAFVSRQLEELRKTDAVAFYETRAREVFLYFRGLAPNEVRTVPVELVAKVPGSWTAPASSAYPYYDEARASWAAPVRATVAR
ncbi:MAG: AgmX/PglI C-terminal domain-containing protein [Myxococcota bacterium]